MEWIEREKQKCIYLFEKIDLRDIERNSIKCYFDSLNKENVNEN